MLREGLFSPEVKPVHRRHEAVRLRLGDVGLPKNRRSVFDIASAQGKPVNLPPPTKAALLAWLETP
jgi:hypothetical protein